MKKRTYEASNAAKRQICTVLKELMTQKPLNRITVASRTKKDGFSVSLRTVSAPSGNPGPITAQGRSGSPPIASGRRPP